jgi:hypothetical protein
VTTILLSYAAGAPVHFANQRALLASARRVGGFDRLDARGPLAEDHPLRAAHPEILALSRGAGSWLWKPQIVLEALDGAAPDDIVVYVDSGARVRRSLAPLVALARRHDAVLIVNDHANAPHTKRDAFVLTDTDAPDCHGAPQLDAALMLWRNTPASRRLVAAWLDACCDARALTDQPSCCGRPELPSFRGHRHDQALLSLLLWRKDHGCALAVLRRDAKYRFLEHHRRRVRWVPVAIWHATHDGPWELRRARSRRGRVLRRRAEHARHAAVACAMRRLPDLRLYSSVDGCLEFLRSLPPAPPPAAAPLPVHFYWDGGDFGAKPALSLRSFLATQDPRRVRPWLWLAHPRAWAGRSSNPHLEPLLPHLEARRFDLDSLAAGTPFEGHPWSAGLGPAAVSDLARLVVLFHHGGCYSDLDAVFLRDLGPLLALAGEEELCFQWSLCPSGTNAFCRHRSGSPVLVDLMVRGRAARRVHPRRLLSFADAPAELLMLPAAAFSPLWLVHDGHAASAFAPFTRFEEFFAPRSPGDPRRATLETFFPGAFTYHWHGNWRAPEHASSWAGQLAEDVQLRLLRTLPAAAPGPRFGT